MPAKHTVYFEFKADREPTADEKREISKYFKEDLGSKLKTLYHANNTFSVRGPTDGEEPLTEAHCSAVLHKIHHELGHLKLPTFSKIENFKVTSSAKLRGGSRRRHHSRRRRTSRR
jgi:hypothetical protein